MGGHVGSRTGPLIKKTREGIAPSTLFRQLPGEERQYPTSLSKIKLSEREEKIFDILKRAGEKAGTQVRVAGGWVRDKLLGLNNNDIDISVDGMTGEQFARHVANELGTDPNNIAVIKENPEQSKHLATATMKIEGLPIDIVNLRSEEYASDSRVPVQKMGTPQEDASRRDLTINSLFYNVNTGEVEDHTGKGLEDLKNGVARAPLAGKQTFMDDPLRVLRVIRFACRFGHKIDPETMAAMKDPEVLAAFEKKVAPERIHKELDGALITDPEKAVRLWFETGFIDKIIPEAKAMDMDQQSIWHDKTVLDHTVAFLKHIHELDPKNVDLKWAALLHDIGKPPSAVMGTDGHLHFGGHDKKGAEMAEEILKRLKYPKAQINAVRRLVANHMRLEHMAGSPSFPFEKDSEHLKLHQGLRDIAKTPEELQNLLKLRAADITSMSPAFYDENMERYRAMLERLKRVDLQRILSMQPYVDGHELQKLFGMKGGSWIASVNDQLMRLQLSGKIKNKEEAIEYLSKINVDADGKITQKPLAVTNNEIMDLLGKAPGPWMKEAMALVAEMQKQGKSKEEIVMELRQKFSEE